MPKQKISKITESVLRDDEKSRNSDKRLQFLVLERMGFRFTREQMQIWGSVSLESIRRTRQKLQENGQYVASDNIKSERNYRAAQVQQTVKTTKPKDIGDLVEGKR